MRGKMSDKIICSVYLQLLNVHDETNLRSFFSCYPFIFFKVEAQEKVFPGADEETPSKAQHFSWINNTNEETDEEQTRTKLDSFA